MRLKDLRRTHREYDAETLRTHDDLFAGGAQFRRAVDRYLTRHDVEPLEVYTRRCKAAHYLGYVAPIVNYFASWLLTCPPTFTSDPAEPDKFYTAFKEDCDGRGTDLTQFLRQAFVRAAIDRRAFWRVCFPAPAPVTPTDGAAPDTAPAPMVRADWEAAGLGRATLVPVPACNVTHWRRDPETGAFLWLVEHDCREELLEWDDADVTVTETWTLWAADGEARCWAIAYPKDKPPSDDTPVDEIDAPANPIGALPFVELALPLELWILNQLADGQLEHFRKANALSWSIDRTCYAMPFFFLKDRRRPPRMGRGYYGILGIDEKIEWPAPPAAPFDTIQSYNEKLRDELHRVAHQMAVAVDNKAAAVGRSGESKQQDNRATEIVLAAYGALVREQVERTFDLVARGREEQVTWSVAGMDRYQIPDAAAITDTAIASESLRIPSVTYRRELFTRVAAAQLPDLDEGKRAQIRKEIEAGVSAEDVAAMTAPPPPPGATLEPDGDEPTAANGAPPAQGMNGRSGRPRAGATPPA